MNASREMPKYECHKKVWALKIAEITEPTDVSGTSRTIVPSDAGYAPFVVDGAYMEKHKPEVGGYYVVYEDGYKSFFTGWRFRERIHATVTANASHGRMRWRRCGR